MLEGWKNKIYYTISRHDVMETLQNIPVLIHVGSESGKNNFDSTIVFDDISSHYKKIAVEIGESGVEATVEVEYWGSTDAYLWVRIPELLSDENTLITLYYDKDNEDNDGNNCFLLHSDTDSGSTDFVNEGSDNTSIVTNGTVFHSDSTYVNGGTSIRFDGGYIYTDNSFNKIAYSKEFTIHFWVNPDSVSSQRGIFSTGTAASAANSLSFAFYLGKIRHCIGNRAIVSTGAPVAGTWMHFATVLKDETLKVYLDGSEIHSVSGVTEKFNNTLLRFGVYKASVDLVGYMDEIVVTQKAIWESNFTPPTSMYNSGKVADTGTYEASKVWNADYSAVFHMSQMPTISESIIDSSKNKNNGTPTSLDYTNSVSGTIGMAIDFDGGFVTTPNTSSSLPTLDYTAECLVKNSGTLVDMSALSMFDGVHCGFSVNKNSTNNFESIFFDGSNSNIISTAATIDSTHLISSFEDSVGSKFTVDGIIIGTDSTVTSPTWMAQDLVIGGQAGATLNPFYGTIEEVRISKVTRTDEYNRVTFLSTSDYLATVSVPTTYYFTGFTKLGGEPVSRVACLYDRDTYQLVEKTVSSGIDGYFELTTSYSGSYFVNIFPEIGDGYNILPYDDIILK